MDSNSTSAPNTHSSSRKGERCCVKGNQFDMATYNDDPESDHFIAFPSFPRPRVHIDSRIALVPKHDPVSSRLQEWELFQNSLIVSGTKPRPRNPWAAIGSVTLLLLVLLALVVIPLFHTDTLPKRERLTMLYMPPAAAASNDTRISVPTSASRYTPTATRLPSPVHMTQEAPSPPLDTPSGVVGGVPGGVVGGIPNGALSQVLRSTSSMPVLAKTIAPVPKRVRVPAQVAEANLVYDVAPKYPPEAGRARIEGTVVLLAVIGKDGSVEDVRVKSGVSALAQAAIEAVKQWRYRPYLLNGEPVELESQITINFTLSKG
jgi:periplasmic protein TonB